ncbi:MAG: hypothetical protein ACJZ2F_02120 [Acidimicrobiales bacterium]
MMTLPASPLLNPADQPAVAETGTTDTFTVVLNAQPDIRCCA